VEPSVTVRTRLRRRAGLVGVGVVSATAAAGVVLSGTLGDDAAFRWGLVAGAVICAGFALLAANLDANRAADAAAPRPRLGSANLVTIARGTLLAWLAGFAVVPWEGGPLAAAPAALYAGNVALDAVDGSLARRVGHVSELGARLDAEFDGAGVLVGLGVAVAADLVPDVLVLVGLVKYAYVAAEWLARRRGHALSPLPDRASRRPLAVLQMLAVAVVLSTLLVRPAAALVAGAVGLAYSLGFARDLWLRVTRRADERVDLVGQQG
jgi:CDP-diacylglycerol--glycerol-3-phosphate 3-phosphatidyltransferase